jgi:hypothetical protein
MTDPTALFTLRCQFGEVMDNPGNGFDGKNLCLHVPSGLGWISLAVEKVFEPFDQL